MADVGTRVRLLPDRAARSWLAFWSLVVVAWGAVVWQHVEAHGSLRSPGVLTVGAGWALMTLAMMAPTAVPMLSSLGALVGGSTGPWWAFIGGYLAVWSGFCVLAAGSQSLLIEAGLVDRHGASVSRWFTAGLLMMAGGYQLSWLKRRCVTTCSRPMTFFLRFWRDGVEGALRMGLRSGVSCLGCCWALMLLAFVGGLHNLWFMVLAAAMMTIEKLPGMADRVTVPIGVGLLVAGLVVLAGQTGADRVGHDQHLGAPDATREVAWTTGRSTAS